MNEQQKEALVAARAQEISFARETTVIAGLGYQPADMESLVRLSQLICRSGLAPNAVRGDAGSVAMLIALGSTLGLSWAQSVQELQVINGKVSCSAVLLHARCQQSPACEQFDVIEATDKVATVRVKRRGWKEHLDLAYTIEDAAKQGLLARGGAWKTVPRAMLVARARAEAARRWFPEVVVGFYSVEEMADSASAQVPVVASASPAEKLVSAAKSAAAHLTVQPESVEVEVEAPRKVVAVVKGKPAQVVEQLEEMAEAMDAPPESAS